MLAAGTSLGPYQILAPLGAGGMGEVYRARDARLGRDVAVKVIHAEAASDPERIKRFEQEARAAGALNHPNICAIHDLGTHEGSPFVVMELLEGESLRARLDAGPVPARKAIDWAAQAAHGLAAAHEKGIVHRDLKPENLFITKDGRVKVLDFGLAKLTRPEVLAPTGERPISIAATETGVILGTVGYMAPEQVLGKPADARSDLFALGSILYELLTGKRAFHGTSYVETLHAILNEEPAPLSASGREVPATLQPIVRRCLEKSPEERFQNASDLAFHLENIGGNSSGLPSASAANTRSRRHLSLTHVAALLAGGLLATMGFALYATHRPVNDSANLKFTKLTFERGRVFNARFGPDGKTVLYDAAWEGRPWEIFETRPGFVASRSLGLPATLLLAVSNRGMMAIRQKAWGTWTWGEGVAEVPMSGGTPRRLVENATYGADWRPDGNALAILTMQGDTSRLEMPPGRVLYETKGLILARVRVSPDGRYVALMDWPSARRWRVIVIDTTGRVRAQSGEWPFGHNVAWSPDGREVWFSVGNDLSMSELHGLTPEGRERLIARLPGRMGLCDVARDGGVLMFRNIARSGIRGWSSPRDDGLELGWLDQSRLADLSDDGKVLLLSDSGPAAGPYSAVFLRGMDGSPAVRLGEGRAESLSPDGKWALALQLREPSRLVLLPTGAGDSLILPRGHIEKYAEARFMPDGKSVLIMGAESGRGFRSYLQDIPGGVPRPVTPEHKVVELVSPDGRRFVYRDRDRLYVGLVGGKDAAAVADVAPEERLVQWASDGRWLYVARTDSTFRVSRLDLETGARVPWKTINFSDRAGLALVNSVLTISPNGKAYAVSYERAQSDLFLVEGLK